METFLFYVIQMMFIMRTKLCVMEFNFCIKNTKLRQERCSSFFSFEKLFRRSYCYLVVKLCINFNNHLRWIGYHICINYTEINQGRSYTDKTSIYIFPRVQFINISLKNTICKNISALLLANNETVLLNHKPTKAWI